VVKRSTCPPPTGGDRQTCQSTSGLSISSRARGHNPVRVREAASHARRVRQGRSERPALYAVIQAGPACRADSALCVEGLCHDPQVRNATFLSVCRCFASPPVNLDQSFDLADPKRASARTGRWLSGRQAGRAVFTSSQRLVASFKRFESQVIDAHRTPAASRWIPKRIRRKAPRLRSRIPNMETQPAHQSCAVHSDPDRTLAVFESAFTELLAIRAICRISPIPTRYGGPGRGWSEPKVDIRPSITSRLRPAAEDRDPSVEIWSRLSAAGSAWSGYGPRCRLGSR